jgi:hypothetical protein
MVTCMRRCAAILCVLTLSACASTPPMPLAWSVVQLGMMHSDVQTMLGEPHVVQQHPEPAGPRERYDHEWCLTVEPIHVEQPVETWLYREANHHTLVVQFREDRSVLRVAKATRK